MIYFIIFFISSISFIIFKNNISLISLYRIFKKILYPKKFEIPTLSPFDFPLPPFPNTWYPICLSYELKINTLRKEKIAGREFILYRGSDGVAHAISNKCSHMGVDLVYGHVENDCVVCPFHNKCNKPNQKDDETFFIEETNHVIFIWIGDLQNAKPFRSMADLIKKYTEPEKYMFSFSFFKRKIGGHLVDYAEHLLDVNHTLCIHGITVDTKYTSVELTDHSFSVAFKIEDNYLTPKFTYITPTFGFVEYTENIKVYIIFVVREVGYVEMILLPNGNNVKQMIYSFLGSLYTQLDFADEAAFFTTKSHDIRNLLGNEKPMQNFREWFKHKFYVSTQLDKFFENKKKYLQHKMSNDW
jgi:nitrite reductase/ring-hydroxylating ferredoxin subunit